MRAFPHFTHLTIEATLAPFNAPLCFMRLATTSRAARAMPASTPDPETWAAHKEVALNYDETIDVIRAALLFGALLVPYPVAAPVLVSASRGQW